MRRPDAEWVVPVAAGIGLGAFATATDVLGSSRTVLLVGELAGPWLLVAYVVGRRRDTAGSAALHGLVALLVGVLVYDAVFVVAGSSPLYAALWLVVAVVVGPSGGATGWVSRSATSTWLRAGAHAAVWGVVVGEAAGRADPLNNRMAWVAAAFAVAAVVTAPRDRRVVAVAGAAAVAVLSAVAFPLLLDGIAGW